MRVGIISSAIPLLRGGYRLIAEWLDETLRERGHETELIYLPFSDEPDHLLSQMNAFRLLDLSAFDRIITLRPPAHVVRHPRKVVWFIHHLRVFYDLWDTVYRGMPDTLGNRALRAAVHRVDTTALAEAHRVFTNSHAVAGRLRRYNGIEGDVLYPPILRPQAFTQGPYGDEIVCICRMEHHKRQHLLIDALARTRTPVRLRLCGLGDDPSYPDALRRAAAAAGVPDRLTIEERWISEEEKAARLSGALAAAYVPLDEDSYGYPTIEAAHAARCTVTLGDAGGVLEFIVDGVNGLVAADAAGLASVFDQLYLDRNLARSLGEAARDRLEALGIEWDTVVANLLA